MIKKLFLTVLFALATINTNAQSIGMIGSFNGWAGDVVMNTTDNVSYTLTAYTFLASGDFKFRQDGAWTTNWGAPVSGNISTPSPTTGVAAPNGSNNFWILAGTYDIAINITTGAYSFTPVSLGFDEIGFNGGFNSWGANVIMGTADGVSYLKTDYHFTAADVKFNRTTPATTWGGTAFPSGTATVGGAAIPLTAGFYNVDFNKTSLLYNFVQVPVSIIGTGSPAADTTTDIPMVTTDGGVTFSLSNVPLTAGWIKFRTNNNWATNWGGTFAPSGIATLNASDMIVTAGNFDITFNRITGAFTFTQLGVTAIDVVNGAVASAMASSDGVNYTKDDLNYASAGAKFQNNATPSTFWGGTMFPNGTATLSGADIPLTAGNYNCTFNSSTLAYTFTVTPLGIIGDATAGGWGSDQDMTSTDGIAYTASNIVLTAGQVKFRSNDSWGTAWGTADANPNAATAFPTGTGVTTGANNIDVVPGTYNVTFNRLTGAYTFTDALATSQFDNASFAMYPNPTNNSFKLNANTTNVAIYTTTGQLVKQFNGSFDNNATFSVNDLSNGIYIVKIADADNNSKSLKLVKQ